MYVVQLKYVMATQVGIPFYFVIFKSASMPIYKLVLLIIKTLFSVYIPVWQWEFHAFETM